MANEIILNGITFEQLQDSLKSIVRNEVEQLKSTLPTIDPAPEFITRKQTAEILGVSLPTLNEWTKTGIVTASRIGTRVRYKRTDVYNSLQEIQTFKQRRK